MFSNQAPGVEVGEVGKSRWRWMGISWSVTQAWRESRILQMSGPGKHHVQQSGCSQKQSTAQ